MKPYPSGFTKGGLVTNIIEYLESQAKKARESVVKMAASPVGCHLGGSLSVIDLLIAAYYVFGSDPDSRIILSKGHAAAALYAVLHVNNIIKEPPELGYGCYPSQLTGHPNHSIQGVHFPTGSLGHGLPLGVGWALSQQIKESKGIALVIAGDGELQEGLCWEAIQVACANRVHNFVLVVDQNGGQNDGMVSNISPMCPLEHIFNSFGMESSCVDGHNLPDILKCFLSIRDEHDCFKPKAIIAKTIKGKGIKQLEGKYSSHYVTLRPSDAIHWIRSLA
jgi:transketolase